MKYAVTLAVLAATGCATAVDSESSTADQATVLPAGLTSTSTTCLWQVDRNCYGQLNDGNNLWPTGMGITSAYVLLRSGPTRLSGRQQTFLAFVVWNDAVVGRIFEVDVGTSNATNFNTVLANTFANRTFTLAGSGILDTSAGSTGSTAGSPSPPPHPNVEGPVTFDSTYLGTVVNVAATLRKTTNEFTATKSVID